MEDKKKSLEPWEDLILRKKEAARRIIELSSELSLTVCPQLGHTEMGGKLNGSPASGKADTLVCGWRDVLDFLDELEERRERKRNRKK